MTEPLIAAILASPADDAPRLVYADWLQQRGDPRGELIGVQVERARSDTPALAAREAELLAAHRAEWEAPFATSELTLAWSRGFPSILTGSGGAFLDSRQLLKDLPVDSLSLTSMVHIKLAKILEWKGIDRVMALELGADNLAETHATALAKTPLAQLRRLSLAANAFERRAMLALGRASWLPRIEELSIVKNPLGATGFAELPRLPKLRRLRIEQGDVGNAGVLALLRTAPRALEYLVLINAGIRVDGVVALAGCGELGALRTLGLAKNGVFDAGAMALAASIELRSLVELDLTDCAITDAGVTAFATARSNLQRLDLGANHITVIGARALASSTTLAALATLDLGGNELGVAGVTALAERTGLPGLRDLRVSNNIMTDQTTPVVDETGTTVGETPVFERADALRARFASHPELRIT